MKLTKAMTKKVVARSAVCVLVTFVLRYAVPAIFRVLGFGSGSVEFAENLTDITLLIAGLCFGTSIVVWLVTELTNEKEEEK